MSYETPVDAVTPDLFHQVDTLLEISRFKKYSCEKCPYASGKRSHFLRHMELHGSRQRHTCQYCDYSVPSITLLAQHQRIHLMPNQNLLATQSFSNLQHLKEVREQNLSSNLQHLKEVREQNLSFSRLQHLKEVREQNLLVTRFFCST